MRGSTALPVSLCLALLLSACSTHGKDSIPEPWTEGDEWKKELSADASRRFLQARPLGANDAMIANKCVFIFATGRSGSTAVVDALNQIPGYLIRGEQGASFYQLFEAYRSLLGTIKTADKLYPKGVHTVLHKANGTDAYPRSQLVHALYERDAQIYKLPWFHDLNPTRIRDAARAMYAVLFGYHGPDVVSGFKEIRYGCCYHFKRDGQADFEAFVAFLRSLCLDAKFIFNSRKAANAADNTKLMTMIRPTDAAAFIKDLNTTHFWYDTYAAAHPDHAIRVYMEDMYGDQQTQARVRRSLLSFLGQDPSLPIRFDRMPIVTPEEYMKGMQVRRDAGLKHTRPHSPPPQGSSVHRLFHSRRTSRARRRPGQ